MCRLIGKVIANLKQKEKKRLLAGQDEMTVLIMQLQRDDARCHVRQNDERRIPHLLLVPENVPELQMIEGKTMMVHMDETYRINKHNIGLLHGFCSSNIKITYTLRYCFMQTAKEVDLTWILESFNNLG